MKLNEEMRYPHPVLSVFAKDYVSGEFRAQFEQNVTAKGELRIASHLALTSPVLLDAINSQQAAAGYFVVSRRTYFNKLQEAPLGDSEKFFDLSQLFGAVTIRPVVWTLQDIAEFRSPEFDPEFGGSVPVARGTIVALGQEFRFSVDPKKYKPFDSIFQLDESDGVPPGTVDVDPDQDRITILAESKTFRSIAGMRQMPAGKSLLLNAVYMPAVMEVVARLQGGNSGFESRKWYRVFRAKCDDLGINPADDTRSPLSVAQKLLREPLKKVIAVAENL